VPPGPCGVEMNNLSKKTNKYCERIMKSNRPAGAAVKASRKRGGSAAEAPETKPSKEDCHGFDPRPICWGEIIKKRRSLQQVGVFGEEHFQLKNSDNEPDGVNARRR